MKGFSHLFVVTPHINDQNKQYEKQRVNCKYKKFIGESFF